MARDRARGRDAAPAATPRALAAVRGIGLVGTDARRGRCSTRGDRGAAPGDPVERRAQRRGMRRARAPRAAQPRDHRQSRDARLHGAEAAVGGGARAGGRSPRPRACCCRRTTCGCASPASTSSEMSDAAGTLWLDVGAPRLVAGDARRHRARRRAPCRGSSKAASPPARCAATSPTPGACRPTSWSPAAAATTPPARSASASIRPGDAFLSLGTSGVYFVAGDRFAPAPRTRRARVLPLPAAHLAPDVGDPQRRELPQLGRRA